MIPSQRSQFWFWCRIQHKLGMVQLLDYNKLFLLSDVVQPFTISCYFLVFVVFCENCYFRIVDGTVERNGSRQWG